MKKSRTEGLSYKFLILFFAVSACIILAVFVGFIMNKTIVYTHFFYIPILLAGVWYRKKAIYVALFLSFFYVLVTLFSPQAELSVHVFERSAIFVVVAYVIGFVSEKRAKGEEKLKETKEYLDNIITSSADAIAVVDMEGIVRSWNKAAEDYMGYTADEVIGTSNKKFFADPEEAERIMEIVLRDGELKNYRTTVLNKDKKPVHVSMSAALLRDKNGVPVGTVRVSRDVTKEVELEEKIKEERDNLNLILESMDDGVYISKDYEVEFMNKVLIDEFGKQVGGICYKVFHDREEPCPLCKNTEVMKGETVRWEWHSRRMNKTYDLIETPLRNVDGSISKLTIFRDISERKRMEDELRETCEKLAELDKMKRDFLNVAYHEMRSPLAPIVGYASLLERCEIPDKGRKYVSNIEQCARELEKMINRMLELARIDSRKVELILEDFSIPEAVREVVKSVEPEAKAKKQVISTVVPGIEIQADKQKTVAIFSNLISNAIKYTPEGGRIDIMVEDRGEKIRVCVTDTGIGISEEHLPKIFERFYMVDTSLTRKSGSLGLGLSIVKEYVKLHGGIVWVTSEVGKGSKFVFIMPKRQK
ncbi:MAG: ATP-binding protein [Halobacteriota archaeon]